MKKSKQTATVIGMVLVWIGCGLGAIGCSKRSPEKTASTWEKLYSEQPSDVNEALDKLAEQYKTEGESQ